MPAAFTVTGVAPPPNVRLVDENGYITNEWRRQFVEPTVQSLYYQGEDVISVLDAAKLESGDDVSELVNDVNYVTAAESQEIVEDFVGAMVTGNTESRILVTYDDTAGKLNFTVEDDLAVYDNTNSAFITNATAALATSKITSGTFADARIAESNVTQHEAALTLAASQTTAGTFASARISAASVTQHEAALTIAQSQVTGLTTALGGKVSTTTITSLTDSTGGSSGGTLSAVGDTSTTDQSSTINDNFASLNAKLNAVLSALA